MSFYKHLGPEGNYLGQYGYYFTDRYHTPWLAIDVEMWALAPDAFLANHSSCAAILAATEQSP